MVVGGIMPAPIREEVVMNSMLIRSGLAGLMAVSMLAFAPAAFAEMVMYKADLKSSAEVPPVDGKASGALTATYDTRSEEHTSELQSHSDLVCRLLLEKKKKK